MKDATRKVSNVGRPLRTISEIRSFFRTNARPIFFVGPTAFNLLGIDRWVRNFGYLVYYDSWDGAHPRVFTPKNKPFVEFESSEEINNYLLRDPEVQARVTSRVRSSGVAPMIAMALRVRQGPVDVRVGGLHPDQARHAVPRLRGLTLGSSVPAFHTFDDAGRARRLGRCGIADRPEPGQVLADGGEGPDRVDQMGGVLSRRPG